MIFKFISFNASFLQHFNTNQSINSSLIKHLIQIQSLFSRQFSSFKGKDLNSPVFEDEEAPDFEEINVENFSQLITSNETRDKIERILSEYEYEKYTTLEVSKTLTIDNMTALLRAEDETERKEMMKFFYGKESRKLDKKKFDKEKSDKYWAEKYRDYAQRKENLIPITGIFDGNGNIVYGLWHNCFFAKILRNQVKRLESNRLRNAAMFGQKIVIDLDFDEYMSLSESRLLCKHIHKSISYNKSKTIEPFDIHFTNCNPEMPTMELIPGFMQNYNSPKFMSPFHRKSYMDLFPKERLVYITQSAPKALKKYCHDDIYILAGHINKSCRLPLAYTKAVKEGIRVFRLPTDEHVLWNKSISKSLALNDIIAILHDMSMGGKWRKSIIDNVPKYKQKTDEDVQSEDHLRKQKIKRIRLESMHKSNRSKS